MHTPIHIHEHPYKNHALLVNIFSLDKCVDFSRRDRELIQKAYMLSQKAHKNDFQKSGTPYMNHIHGVTLGYLNITKKSRVSADDLCVAILHDVIEDHPEFSEQVKSQFGGKIHSRILSISKPTIQIIDRVLGRVSQALLHSRPVSSEYLIGKLTKRGQIVEDHMDIHLRLSGLWNSEIIKNEKKLTNYVFLWMIADLYEDDFEIKCADRINNLDNLVAVDTVYVNKNIGSTELYIGKARALGREDLAFMLENGMENLMKKKKELEAAISI